jgi:hypothetical protein
MEEPQPQPQIRPSTIVQFQTSSDFPQGDVAMRLEITRLQQQVVQLETALLEAQGSSGEAPMQIPSMIEMGGGKGSLRTAVPNGNVMKPGHVLAWPQTFA